MATTDIDLDFGVGQVNLPATAQIAAESAAGLYPTSAIDISGKKQVIIKVSFSVASAIQEFRILMFDSDSELMGCLPSVSEVYTAVASATEQDGASRYIGTMFVFSNESGATSLKIRMIGTPSSGNVSFFVAGV